MKNKRIGNLGYNPENERYGILVTDLWEDEGLHCGVMVEVKINGEWVTDRIELSEEWYLVHSKLKGEQLEGLLVRF